MERHNTISARVVFSGKIVEVVHEYDPQSKRVLEKVRRSPGVRLIITTDDHKFVLTKELRKEVGGYDIRLPGGKVLTRSMSIVPLVMRERTSWKRLKRRQEKRLEKRWELNRKTPLSHHIHVWRHS